MFDLQQFVADCRLALAEDQSHKSVREVVARAVSDPSSVLKGLGEPRRAEVQKLYQSEDLTILNVIWGPRMTIMPHNHQNVGSHWRVYRPRGQYSLAPHPGRREW